ncbi:MAG TPA: dephospho-CoA kinase [Spirochaetota bacterium]|jgi:dephospho-CoA kinase|nr:dephospho-CoA kinase [Spirochaetota bacterium]HON16281.1 dephospho-CoA kinase [Spirochaetota bacterium]HOV09535.1 dephospho-CoA kinase [Spirochaetota bacterium]HPD76823.1 dephospho-CoA kinase [Spirochaetota bacterium]HPX90151.1 dephospho-CoA kinase [Spirochaetota bacterium]
MRVGVTGIFASGKGTVCELFRELGASVIDTDLIAREIMEPGKKGLQDLIHEFGDSFIKSDGTLDRRAFANYVFSCEEKVRRLNEITHPIILNIVLERSKGNGIYMINTPLLFESGFDRYMDKNIVVTAGDEQVILRGCKRDNISPEEIKERLKHQIPLNEKIKLADYVIDNSGSIEQTKRQVFDIWKVLNQSKEV